MNINWKVRSKNKAFWLTIIPLMFVFVHRVLIIFGIDFDYSVINKQIIDLVDTIFLILGALGVVNDPTTDTLNDSKLAMTYDEPKPY